MEAEPAEPAAPPPSEEPEAPKPEPPEPAKPKPRRKKATVLEPAQQEPPRAKRQNQRTATPPALLVDQTFWAGLLATQKARKREHRQQTLSNFRIFS